MAVDFGQEFDDQMKARYDMGMKKYGNKYLFADIPGKEILEELIDVANYAKMQYMKLKQVTTSSTTKKITLVPMNYTESFDEYNEMYLILAHLLLQKGSYYEFFKKSKKYKILDNSSFELKNPLGNYEILSIAEDVGVDEVVVPDVLCNKGRTLILYDRFMEIVPADRKYKLMGVPQGSDLDEWKECCDIMKNHVDVIGIPKYAPFNRIEVLTSNQLDSDLEYHMLGCNSLSEWCFNHELVRSMDSSFLVRTVHGKFDWDMSLTNNEILLAKSMLLKFSGGDI